MNGFRQLTNGQYTETFFHYYLTESRSYIRNDTSLCGAYNFLTASFLEKQCYANGVMIWYRNSSVPDNNTSEHPGTGQILPVDAHPTASYMPDGRTLWYARWQTWDASFGVDPHAVTLTQVISKGRALTRTYEAPAEGSFVDASPTSYFDSAAPFNSVLTAGSGLRIDIVGVSEDRGSYRLHIYK